MNNSFYDPLFHVKLISLAFGKKIRYNARCFVIVDNLMQ
jgi:hypothetical protein